MTNQAATGMKLKETGASKQQRPLAIAWEYDAIGRFLLPLNRMKIFGAQNDYLISKNDMRIRFEQFLGLPENKGLREKFAVSSKNDIGSILYRTDYLINTARGSQLYRIKRNTLDDYRKRFLNEWEDKVNNGLLVNNSNRNACANDNTEEEKFASLAGFLDPVLDSYHEVDATAKVHSLIYQGTIEEKVKADFILTNWSCYICQMNFDDPNDYEQHVEEHGDEGDFKLLRNMTKYETPLLELSYQLCKKSHYFCFTIKTSQTDVIIDKIIVVQSRSMFYVQNARMPYEFPANGKETFFVDSHLFTIHLEQPIVVVFHTKTNSVCRLVEQHHFIRTEEFPKMTIAINPNLLPNSQKFKQKRQLSQYLPPPELRLALFKSKAMNWLTVSNKFADYCATDQNLTQRNIHEVLKILLQIEDLDTMEQYRKLTQCNVKLRQVDQDILLKLKLKTSSDNILSPYDDAIMIPNSANNGCKTNLNELIMHNMENIEEKKMKIYHGSLERVSNDRVTILCDKKIDTSEMYTVVFRPMRLTLRYQYRALEMLKTLQGKDIERILFPKTVNPPRALHLHNFTLFNENIASNPEQLQAVMNIANGPDPEAPYIIFGPPGTGKTTTVVEAIMQLYVRRPDTRILITAGSNSACDEVALRLYSLLESRDEPRAMVRIYARSVESNVEKIDGNLLECSNLYDAHFYPAIDVLHEYRIVICTLTVVGKLCTGALQNIGWYTHIFVDECAASTEMETLVGIMGALSPNANLIISGDHKQLGPILQSQRADSLGLGTSLFERLINRECYHIKDDGSYNFNYQARLCRNYRSHPQIVRLYNELYYGGDLVAKPKNDIYDFGRMWYRCPNPQFPILFHSVFGSSGQDENSPSLYNALELEVVLDYVRDLMYFGVGGVQVTQTDIGIISPYKRQYQLIQEQLNLRKWYNIQTGSVETFQGKEKKIIIVSFVRSFSKTIGFLKNPRRLNVTLSRAKALLILIGNPKTLSLNDDFKHIIDECKQHNTLIGATIYDDDRPSVVKTRNDGANNIKIAAESIVTVADNSVKSKYPNKRAKMAAKLQRRRERKRQEQQQKDNENIAAVEHPNQQKTNLRQPMKKHVTSPSMQEKRLEFEKFKNTIELNVGENAKTIQDSTLDDLFDLPKVPISKPQQAAVLVNIPMCIRKNSTKSSDELEIELRNKLKRLQLRAQQTQSETTKTVTSPISAAPLVATNTPAATVTSPVLPMRPTTSAASRTTPIDNKQLLNSSFEFIGRPQNNQNPIMKMAALRDQMRSNTTTYMRQSSSQYETSLFGTPPPRNKPKNKSSCVIS